MSFTPLAAAKPRFLSLRAQLALVLLPPIITGVLLLWVATSVPLLDDYTHLIAFSLEFQKIPTLAGKIGLLFTTQVGPYKLIFDHLLISLQLLVFGRLNFPILIVLGNLTVVGLFLFLWKNTPREDHTEGRRLLVLVPVSLLLFGLNYAETVDWAVSGLQQPAVILFAFAAIHYLVKPAGSARDFAIACVFSLLACATYANGVLVWPVGFIFLLVERRQIAAFPQKLGIWCIASGLSGAVYFYHYSFEGLVAKTSLFSKFVFLATFCGGALENMHHRPIPYISVAIGLAALAVFVWSIRTRYDRRNPFFFYSTVWILFTGVVVANARMAMGMQLSLSSRYKIYCDLLLIFCYEYLLDRYRTRAESTNTGPAPMRRFMAASITAALIVYVAGNVAGGHFLRVRQTKAVAAMQGYLAAPETASPMFLTEDVLNPSEIAMEDLARQQLTEAIRIGIYTPPKF